MAVPVLNTKWSTTLLPVTALGYVKLREYSILLVGTGCILEAIDLQTSTRLCTIVTSTCQAIKSILPLGDKGHDDHALETDILVQGGNHVIWTKLSIEISQDSIIGLRFDIVHSIRLQDWVINGRAEDGSNCGATFLTSYNALYHVAIDDSSQKLNHNCLNDELSAFLYSGDVAALDTKSYIIASGTAFGEVLIWRCEFYEQEQRWVAVPWREYRGHRGSIFGVSISPELCHGGQHRRLVASCSDDRMIHIWDYSHAGPEVKGLCAADDSNLANVVAKTFTVSTANLAVTWAHGSRIWTVDLVPYVKYDLTEPQYQLISTGEDATAQSWLLQLDDQSEAQLPSRVNLQNKYIDNHHAGKNIWSRCHAVRDNNRELYTGGADGQVVLRSYCTFGRADITARQASQTFKEVSSSLQSYDILKRPGQKPFALKSYLVPKPGQILATTDSGHLLNGLLHDSRISWQLLLTSSNPAPFVLASQMIANFAFLVDSPRKSLVAYNITTTHATDLCSIRQAKVSSVEALWSDQHPASSSINACIAICYFGVTELDLIWIRIDGNSCTSISSSSVCLPDTFEVSSACYHSNFSILLIGSRAGAMAIYANVSSISTRTESVCCKRHVHGSDTVTSIRRLDEERETHEHGLSYLTTGRDGTYCVVKIKLDYEQPTSSPPSIDVVHHIVPPLGPNIEGSYLVRQPDGSRRLLLYGFRSTHFVVWDETNQTEFMAVDCGGAHRSWSFTLDEATGEGGTFVWTKAGTLMLYEQSLPDHRIIKSGGHGREIKALAVHCSSTFRKLIATGSEDTDIRLFESCINDAGRRNIKCITVIKRHTTGLQDLKFSHDGKMLFSAAGMEEMYAWKLSPVPVPGQGVVFAGALPNNDSKSDARIMSFDLRYASSDPEDTNYLIVAAFSNGKVKLISYTSSSGSDSIGSFTIINQLDLGTTCLTQAHFNHSPTSDQNLLMVAGTNGFINLCYIQATISDDESEKRNTPPAIHKIHQNSITAMQTIQVTDSLQLLITGGDDNALAITLYPLNKTKTIKPKTLIIPKAHAAALTALAVTQLNSSSPNTYLYTIITASNDQRLKIWNVTLDQPVSQNQEQSNSTQDEEISLDNVQIDLLQDTYTNVADISEIAVLESTSTGPSHAHHPESNNLNPSTKSNDRMQDTSTHTRTRAIEVLIVGVGMEVIQLDIPELESESER